MSTDNNNNGDDVAPPQEISQRLPIRLSSCVVRGFGRGSSDLGIPTANLDLNKQGSASWSVPEARAPTLQDLPTGIYWGYARIVGDNDDDDDDDTTGDSSSQPQPQQQVYTAAISIGYNPTYGNEQKTIEPHLIAPETDARRHASSCGETVMGDFYDRSIRLSVCGYLRPELPFEGLEKLIQAIKQDIVQSVELGKTVPTKDENIQKEHAWVAASSPPSTSL